jgi:UDP-glucose 6-dehydrogenase
LPRVTVIGTGYLGLTHAVCLADLGHEVLAIDVDAEKIAMAASGEAPFFEPGLEPLLRKNLDSGRLRFTMSFAEVGGFGEVHFLCVGTPEGESGRADLGAVLPSAARKRPGLRYAPSVSEAAEGADLVLHLTEWSDYRAIDPAALARVVARRVIIDARCCLDAGLWRKAGWIVHVLGRPQG